MESTNNRKMTLLIVEDEIKIRELIQDDLHQYDINILTAENGKVALDILLEHQVDAVLSDISMPVMDGFTLLRMARKCGMTTPFIFLTAYADRKNFVSALSLSAVDLIEKPWISDELIRSVNFALNLGVQLRSLEADVSEMLERYHVPSENFEEVRGRFREVLILKKVNNLNFLDDLPLKKSA
jgi:response regulator RpfG family c-di-GMP phosphodiesterase